MAQWRDTEEKLEPVDDSFDPLQQADVERIEEVVGRKLPPSYVDFLKTYGRSMFTGAAFIKSDAGTRIPISAMFGRGSDTGSIAETLELHPQLVRQNLVPIAHNFFNDIFVLDGNTGRIWFVEFADGQAKSVPVAASFDHFLGQIEVGPEEQ